ncbi:TetR/AcrR family transcriptional regulator [Nonomuraea rhodomycinica]|uniref:TetR/AcrR family transcriptional regulator n=1 Tax=Nonomuraea rhodomycinica TaxID=1712872 RepID=A0A7Y6MCR3_9ACTN|nr:TetR/AcrR family transcriptional regulator [Nonomuraea rhodomycinica]NUW42016.1 TetR/AcrR family transcriptional regulator [Nonomuraea rhodomycinica]
MAGVERGRPRDPGNDAAILDAALDLLIERGAGGTSIEGVAQRAGVAKLTVYRRWRTREDLLMAALEHARDPDLQGPPVAGRSLEELIGHVAALLSRSRFRALMARVIGASVDHPKLVTAYTERHLRPRLDALAEVARRAVDDGRLPPGTDPGVLEDVLASSIGFVLLRGEEEVTAAEVERRLRALLGHLGYEPPRQAPPA